MNASRAVYYRDLVLVLLGKDFKVRYKSTVLGYAWSVLHPLLFAAVFYFVFAVVLRVVDFRLPSLEARGVSADGQYALFLLTGLFPWQWFSNSVGAANQFFLGNSSLIKKVRFPREFLVLSGVLGDALHFVLSIPVIVAFMLWVGGRPSVHWLWQVPLLVAVQFLVTQGFALIVATTNLFFRDLERITGLVLMLWLYLTPVIYPVTRLPENLRWLMYVNPMAPLIASWQSVFLEGTLSASMLGVAAAYAVVVWLLGHALYRRLEWRFAEIV
jgi:lipopolysaccharide transport system permease protein